MRVAHFSDLHYCGKHVEWVDRAFSFAVDDAISQNAELAVISGDSFDADIPLHHPAVDRLVSAVHRLANEMPVLILQGTFSHDRPGCLDIFKHLGARHPVCVADRPGFVRLRLGKWERESDLFKGEDFAKYACDMEAKVFVAVLPSVNRADLRAAGEEGTTADVLGNLFAGWNRSAQRVRAAKIPSILVSHGTVNGCVTESKQAMVSPDHEFTTGQLFSAGFSAIMLGHIHAHQSWEKDGRRIAYPGSITKLIYGHAARTGYLIWDIHHSESYFELIETPSRNLVEIEFDGPPDLAELHRRLSTCRDAYVRLRYRVDEEHRHIVDGAAIKAALAAAGVADFKVEGHINPVQRTRAAGITALPSIADKLRRWCELTGTDPAPLLPRLDLLLAGQQPGVDAARGSARREAA